MFGWRPISHCSPLWEGCLMLIYWWYVSGFTGGLGNAGSQPWQRIQCHAVRYIRFILMVLVGWDLRFFIPSLASAVAGIPLFPLLVKSALLSVYSSQWKWFSFKKCHAVNDILFTAWLCSCQGEAWRGDWKMFSPHNFEMILPLTSRALQGAMKTIWC